MPVVTYLPILLQTVCACKFFSFFCTNFAIQLYFFCINNMLKGLQNNL
ncbi:hypothetical protein HMPREF3182_00550 [Megasphaera hutchinsoni]|uniref:Uncharacterized protein n=1 Tax=Megasphaera hutchinsoni TaxID=1588748 RepID=A0A134CJ54_9FIRM|nr:hypothetical protein HMPREF3182_00550 [Megasphaera hutchinsoni]